MKVNDGTGLMNHGLVPATHPATIPSATSHHWPRFWPRITHHHWLAYFNTEMSKVSLTIEAIKIERHITLDSFNRRTSETYFVKNGTAFCVMSKNR